MAQHAHGKAVQNLIDRGIPVRARQARRPPSQRRQRARSQPVNPQNMDRTTQEGNSMKKLAAVIALSTLALGACSTADNTQNERPSVNATATVPEAYTEEPGLKGEPDEITEPASENIEYPPSKGEGCDMEISTYTPYGCDELGLPIIPDGAPLEMRCAIIISRPCTDQENAEYREYVGQVRENFEADMDS